MARIASIDRLPWIPIAIGVAAVGAGMVSLLRVPDAGPAPIPVAPQRVELTRLGAADGELSLQESVALLDPTPLFLPTDLNAGQAGALSDRGRREPSASFGDFPARFAFSEEDPALKFSDRVAVPASPVAALRSDQGHDALSSFGRQPLDVGVLPPRLGFIEVIRAGEGRFTLSGPLAPSDDAPEGDWSPIELIVAVSPSGLVGLPVLTTSSGSEAVDQWMPNYLAKEFRLGERLQPGFYRIRVGP